MEPGAVQSSIWDKSRDSVDEISRSLPPDGLKLYGEAIGRMGKLIAAQEQMAIPAERVAKVIEHALTARRPRTRYLVGTDAKLMAFVHWMLPDRAYDAILALMMRRLAAGAPAPRDARSQATQP